MKKGLAKTVAQALRKKKKTLAVAESCTGGLVCAILTKNAGSSAFFQLGVVTYADEAKHALVRVPARLLARHGAVSRPVAMCMAKNVRKILNSDYGIGITGIAGPTGGTRRKPVGLVYIALSDRKKIQCHRCVFQGTRARIQSAAAAKTLAVLSHYIR